MWYLSPVDAAAVIPTTVTENSKKELSPVSQAKERHGRHFFFSLFGFCRLLNLFFPCGNSAFPKKSKYYCSLVEFSRVSLCTCGLISALETRYIALPYRPSAFLYTESSPRKAEQLRVCVLTPQKLFGKLFLRPEITAKGIQPLLSFPRSNLFLRTRILRRTRSRQPCA